MKEKKIGDILLNARQKVKISQDLLSQKLHISRQCISNWENNYNVPDLEMLKEICKILNISYKKIIKKHPAYRASNQKPPKIIVFLLFLILLFIIIFCLMIKFRTKVAFYEVKIAENDNVSLTNAYFLKTNNNIYFNLGIISFLSSTENIEDYQVKLYLKTKDKIRLIINCNYEDFIIINEKNGYGEYFDNDFGTNALFLDLISLDDSTKIYSFKLNLEEKFPHEIGLFLGYPLGDVIGFIENAGKNSKCAGCWKVYCNECETMKLFEKFKKCTRIYTKLWRQGTSVEKLTVAA